VTIQASTGVEAPAASRGAAPARSSAHPQPSGRTMTPWLWVVLVVVLFAGTLFGYDQGVISGALRGIKSTFSLSSLLVEVVTSWVTLGALFGSLAGGELADRIGRERTVLIAGAMFTLGALVQAIAPDTVVLVAGRLVVGAGVASPPSRRRSTPPNWRRRPFAADSFPATSSRSRSASSLPIWSMAGCRRRARGA
jgi:MFS family permease